MWSTYLIIAALLVVAADIKYKFEMCYEEI